MCGGSELRVGAYMVRLREVFSYEFGYTASYPLSDAPIAVTTEKLVHTRASMYAVSVRMRV